MEAQDTRTNRAPLTVRCCAQRPLGGPSPDDAVNAAPVTHATPQVVPAAEADRPSREVEPAPTR
jgi:hypothetical protein